MAWIEKFIKFLKDNWQLIIDNWYTFLCFLIICVALAMLINKFVNSSKDRQIKELRDEVKRLQDEITNIQSKYDNLQDKFKNSSIGQRLLSGINTSTYSPLTQDMSRDVQEKYSKD